MVDGHSAAQNLRLSQAIAAFSLTPEEFERRYFDIFDSLVAEIRAV